MIAKAPVDTPPAKVKRMLQALLGERFKLAVHADTRPVPQLLLTADKGKAKLNEADSSGETGCGTHLQRGEGSVPIWVATCWIA